MGKYSSFRLARVQVIVGVFTLALLFANNGYAQDSSKRDRTWGSVTLVTMVAAAGVELLMPRVAPNLPDTTVGWNARWHVSVLSPAAAIAGVAVLNEFVLQDALESPRPGCKDLQGTPDCTSYGMFSTHSFVAFSALGQGAAVFLADTLLAGGDAFHPGALVGHVVVPFALAGVTALGRGLGNWETPEQVIASAGVGLATGAILGVVYAALDAPRCGYGGAVICW